MFKECEGILAKVSASAGTRLTFGAYSLELLAAQLTYFGELATPIEENGSSCCNLAL